MIKNLGLHANLSISTSRVVQDWSLILYFVTLALFSPLHHWITRKKQNCLRACSYLVEETAMSLFKISYKVTLCFNPSSVPHSCLLTLPRCDKGEKQRGKSVRNHGLKYRLKKTKDY